MTAKTRILDGRHAPGEIKKDLAARVAALGAKGVTPGLATVLVGDDPGSRAYVAGKHRDCAEAGIHSIRMDLPASARQEEVIEAITQLNQDPACTGYIVQLPLPAGLEAGPLLELMDPAKDADGLRPVNLGRLVLGQEAPLPCTPRAIVELLRRYDVALDGAEVVVVGLRRADVIVAAAGSVGIVGGHDTKPPCSTSGSPARSTVSSATSARPPSAWRGSLRRCRAGWGR